MVTKRSNSLSAALVSAERCSCDTRASEAGPCQVTSMEQDTRTLVRPEPELCDSDDESEEEEDAFTVRELRACEVSPTADSVERRKLL